MQLKSANERMTFHQEKGKVTKKRPQKKNALLKKKSKWLKKKNNKK